MKQAQKNPIPVANIVFSLGRAEQTRAAMIFTRESFQISNMHCAETPKWLQVMRDLPLRLRAMLSNARALLMPGVKSPEMGTQTSQYQGGPKLRPSSGSRNAILHR